MPVFTEKWAHYRCRCYLPKLDPSPLANTAGFLSHSSGWLCCHSNCAEGFVQFHYLPTVHACMPLFPLYPGQATCKHSPGGRVHMRSSSGWQVKRQCVHSRDAHPLGRTLPSPYCPCLPFNTVSSTAMQTPWLPSSLSPTLPGWNPLVFTELQVEI